MGIQPKTIARPTSDLLHEYIEAYQNAEEKLARVSAHLVAWPRDEAIHYMATATSGGEVVVFDTRTHHVVDGEVVER